MLRYFLKAQGAGELFGPGCSEKKVREAKRVAGNSIEYKVGTVNVFNNNGNSNVTTEVCFMAVKSFDAALAWIVADMDSRRTYRSFEFHKSSEFLILIGGDTGGRHFKFVFLSTHQEHANSGDNCNIWFMGEKFKETYRNLQRALVPETAKVIAEFYTLAAAHKEKPTLRGESTYGIVHDPLFPIPLQHVVIPLLHSFLGLFQRSVDALKQDLRKIDQKKLLTLECEIQVYLLSLKKNWKR